MTVALPATSEESKETINKICKMDEKLRDDNKLLGRYVLERIGTETACYEITRISASSVRIKAATRTIVSRWGKEALIPLSYALKNLRLRDKFSKIEFSPHELTTKRVLIIPIMK